MFDFNPEQGKINDLLTRLYGPGHGQRYALGSTPYGGVSRPTLQDQLSVAQAKASGTFNPAAPNMVTDYSAFDVKYAPRPGNMSNAKTGHMDFDSLAQPSYTPESAYRSDSSPVGTEGYGHRSKWEAVADTIASLKGEAPAPSRDFEGEAGYADYLRAAGAHDSEMRTQIGQVQALKDAGISPATFKTLTPLQQGQMLETILASTKSQRPKAFIDGKDVTGDLNESRAGRLDPKIATLLGALSDGGVDYLKGMGASNKQREDYLKATGSQYSKMIHSGELETRPDAQGRQIPHMKIRETVQDPSGFGEKTVYKWVPLNPQQMRDYALARGSGFISDTPQMFQHPAARAYSPIMPDVLKPTGQFEYDQPIGPDKPQWMVDGESGMSPLDKIAVAMKFGKKGPLPAADLFRQHRTSPLPYRY